MDGLTRGTIALMLMATLWGCNVPTNGYRLSGYITDRAGHTAALLHCTLHTTDTMAVCTLSDDGSFSFEGKLDETSICLLRIGHDDLLFMMDNVEMSLTSDTFTNHRLLHIKGYDIAERFNRAVLLDKERIIHYNATEAAMQRRIAAGDRTMTVSVMQQRLDSLDRNFIADLKQHVSDCQDPITAIYLLHLLSTQQEFAYLDSTFERIRKMDSTSIYVKQFDHRLNRARGILDAFVHQID